MLPIFAVFLIHLLDRIRLHVSIMSLDEQNIMYLPGVGPRRAEILKKEIDVTTYDDLLHYFPYRYVDRSRIYTVSELERIVSGHSDRVPFVQLRGRITGYQASEDGRMKRLVARFADSTGAVDLVWFHGQKFILDKYPPGREYLIFGQPKEYMHEFSFIHPEIDPADRAARVSGGLVPMYHTTELMKRATLHSRAIRDLIYTLLNTVSGGLPETLPAWILEERALAPLTESMRQIHFPESAEKLRAAQHRLKFEELFYIQLNILRTATLRRNKLRGIPCPRVGKAFNAFYANRLPFALTGAQKRVVHEIHDDMRSGRQMNRLLQGDVGSGKTLVALMAILLAVDNGCQACLMAPTEILAGQHFATLQELLGDIGVRVELLTGSTTKRRRSALLPAVASGEVDILIGTHALIEDAVVFHRLGLSVIDEQHRFGVEQRSKLWVKSTYVPHVLIMTATPIPRTLAMTVYGDLDVSVIDELPPGRKPVKTVHRYDAKKTELYTFLRTEIGRGRQVYVVYPLIEENETMDYKALEQGYETFREVFPECTVCMVHGKMKAKEKEAEMQKFIRGEAQILVATTVIEVGVNVPNASVMVIESAERFGLSQLHQLRGRVGRGAEQSYCILVTGYKLSEVTRKRLGIIVSTSDGFRIAEEDLKLRGAGDMEGTQQSGDGLSLRIADLAQDGGILRTARDVASRILDADPNLSLPENALLNARLNALFRRRMNWGLIS